MTRREEFIQIVKALFGANARRITTNPFEAGKGKEFAIPVNDLVIIDGHCGAQTILEHESTTKYVIVSGNKFLFDNTKYATVYIIEETNGKPDELYTVLTDAETLALSCGVCNPPIQPVGANANFIANPGAHSLTKYYRTEQEGVFICKEFTLNITEKLNVSIVDDQIHVAPKPTQPSQ